MLLVLNISGNQVIPDLAGFFNIGVHWRKVPWFDLCLISLNETLPTNPTVSESVSVAPYHF